MMPPNIPNAPGLVWREYKVGWTAIWRARADIVRSGFKPKNVLLWRGRDEPAAVEQGYIAEQCTRLQDEMLEWKRGGTTPETPNYDGTLRRLIQLYQTDADSPYRKLRYQTRLNYDNLTGRLERQHGDALIADIKARIMLRWYEGWTAKGHYTMAHSMVGMVRTLLSFGKTILEDPECTRMSSVLGDMRFKAPKPRKERITAEQATAVRRMAHKMGRPSIALAQAFQFECMLRQKDAIGEWVPISEPGLSVVTSGNEKWLRGILWSEIDANLILRHLTSKRQKELEVDLKLAPMVMEELALIGHLPTSGPVIVRETDGLPWSHHEFRRWWRKVAKAAGVPPEVYNMDSRAGGITEASDAGAPLEHIRHAATHSNSLTTQGYSRGSAGKIAEVMQLRSDHRNKR